MPWPSPPTWTCRKPARSASISPRWTSPQPVPDRDSEHFRWASRKIPSVKAGAIIARPGVAGVPVAPVVAGPADGPAASPHDGPRWCGDATGAAAWAGYRVRYALATTLINELIEATNDRQLPKTIARYG